MEDLATRLAERIKQRDVNAPDSPYEMGRVIGLPAAADKEVAKMASEQAVKVKDANDAKSAADANEKDSSNEDKKASK